MLVSVGSDLVFHQSLTESQYARFVRYKRSGQGQKESESETATAEECLKLDVACAAKDVTVKLIYGCASTSLPAAKQSAPPSALVEFHGEGLPANTEKLADAKTAEEAYQKQVEEFKKEAATVTRVGQSA